MYIFFLKEYPETVANDLIALDWNGTNENGMLPTCSLIPSPEDRTSSADLETILGNDEKEQGVCPVLGKPIVLGENTRGLSFWVESAPNLLRANKKSDKSLHQLRGSS